MCGTPGTAALIYDMHHTAPLGVTETESVAESARRVAAGGRPLQRMEAPTLFFQSVAEAFVYLDGKRLVIARIGLASGAITNATAGDVVGTIVVWRTGVIYADRAALAATQKALGTSEKPHRSRAISYICRLPVNGQHAVLTDALAQRFVAPGPAGSLGTWRAAFHLEGLSTPELLVRLAAEASSGDSTVFPAAVAKLRDYGKAIYFDLMQGRSRAVNAYKTTTRHDDLWNAVLHADPLLRDAYLRTGDTITATPFKMLGGIVECNVSTPFKIRPGSAVVVWQDGGQGLPATLVDLGFDQATESLTAKFSTPTTGKRRRNGYDTLFDALNSGESFYVTTQPFDGSGAPGNGGRSPRSWCSGRSVTRELPLFVSLAAAASPQGS